MGISWGIPAGLKLSRVVEVAEGDRSVKSQEIDVYLKQINCCPRREDAGQRSLNKNVCRTRLCLLSGPTALVLHAQGLFIYAKPFSFRKTYCSDSAVGGIVGFPSYGLELGKLMAI